MTSITTCLMFVGNQAGKAEEAINFYTSLFPNAQIVDIAHYGAGEDEKEGTVQSARFTINNVEFMAMDSSLDHKFNFTPSISLYVECESEEELERVYQALSEEGQELVPLDRYELGSRFGWLNDRYGVSWQLNFNEKQ